jgi:hypothetical protein
MKDSDSEMSVSQSPPPQSIVSPIELLMLILSKKLDNLLKEIFCVNGLSDYSRLFFEASVTAKNIAGFFAYFASALYLIIFVPILFFCVYMLFMASWKEISDLAMLYAYLLIVPMSVYLMWSKYSLEQYKKVLFFSVLPILVSFLELYIRCL